MHARKGGFAGFTAPRPSGGKTQCVLAGQVAPDYANRLMLFDIALVEYLHGKKSNYTLGCALLFSRAWIVLLEHARDRGRSAGDGPILEHAQDSQHG